MKRPALRAALAAAVAALVAVLAVLFVQPSVSSAATPIRIMPLGDSITGSPGCWRALLWNRLQANGIANIDMVGTLPPQGCGVTYDGDNEGHGGFLATAIANQNLLPGWLSATHPDVVMMHLGTNDVWSNIAPATILAAFSTLVDQMRASNPSMRILVAQIIPMNPSSCTECAQRVVSFNAAIPAWATGKTTAQSPITVVDQWTGFNTATDTGDGVHPNDLGNQKISDRWYPPLASVLGGATGSPSASPSRSATPSASPSRSASPSASPSSGGAKQCTASYKVTNQWPGGFGADVTVTNSGSMPIAGWTVVLTYANGQVVTQLWNGVHTQSGSAVTVKNMSYNGSLSPAGQAWFGFNASWNNSVNNPPAVSCTAV